MKHSERMLLASGYFTIMKLCFAKIVKRCFKYEITIFKKKEKI